MPYKTVVLLLLLNSTAAAQNRENLFYITDAPDAIASFAAHARQVSVIAPQSFRVDAQGQLTGEVPARIMEIAKANRVPVMPLIVNPGWNLELFHALVNDPAARARTIERMVQLGNQNGFWGWQFDFEQIAVEDRDALTTFFREAATALHANNMKMSIAVYPDPGDLADGRPYHDWLWKFLVGAYDLKALADAGDFISVMTYLQHTPRTPPGPVAGIPYMRRVVETALKQGVAPGKISLGVPFFSMHWYTDWNPEKKGFSWSRGLSWKAVDAIVSSSAATRTWIATQGSTEARWENHGVFEYAWIEDARALQPKLALQQQYHLRGISVWRIGQEDPAVWNRLVR